MSKFLQRLAALPPDKRSTLISRLPPLSFSQQRLWLIDQLEPGGSFYNLPAAFRFRGQLNVAVLERTLNEIMRRHKALKTSFVAIDGQPVQIIDESVTLSLPVIDLSHMPAEEREAEAHRLAGEETRIPFDLSNAPLLRARVLRLGAEEHVALFTMHHIVSDGWSVGVLIREVAALYEAFSRGEESPLAELPIQYADYAVWQREWLQGEVLDRQMQYWREQLGGDLPILELPTDRPRPAVQTHRGAHESVKLSPELSAALKELSRREGATLYMTLLAAFQLLLSRYTGQRDVLVGSPIAGRSRPETEELIGLFINTFVMRGDLSGDPTFRELLSRVKEAALGAYAHPDVPFEKLVEELQPKRSLSHSPLFQTMFVFQNAPMGSLSMPHLTLETFKLAGESARYDLGLTMTEGPEGLTGVLEYKTDLFDAQTVKRMVGHLHTLLSAVVACPDRRISSFPLLTPTEHDALRRWNDTAREYEGEACLHQLFEAQVERTPDATALTFEGESLSYADLNSRANQLAYQLQELGVAPGSVVAILMERSFQMVVALLGTLKAGGAYLPLDPAYPSQRLAFMADDAGARVILTQQHLAGSMSEHGAHVLCLDSEWNTIARQSAENPRSGASAEDRAYIIYTSGSTGRPKGVMIPHSGIRNRIFWMQEEYRLTADDRILQKTPFSFDVSVWEFFWPLLFGARLVIARPEGHKDGDYLVELIKEQGITILHFVPSMLQVFLQARDVERCISLKKVMCSGEALSYELQEQFFARLGAELHNLYGPTEASVDVTYWACAPNRQRVVPIGRPIANTQIHLLDEMLEPVPTGVPAELFIGGLGLASGYLNRPALSASRFIPDHFSTLHGSRLYRTGDLARRLPSGELEYLGRIDQQVKVRGFRIELGEVESVLAQHRDVRECVVAVRRGPDGGPRLVAYLGMSDGGRPTAAQLRLFAQGSLPDYMVPSAFVMLESLPLTRNGKVDYSSLPEPEETATSADALEQTLTPVEELLSGIWASLLKRQRVGLDENFFDLGGHSLLATQLVSRLREAFQVEVSLRSLFEHPTLSGLASVIDAALREGSGASTAPPVTRVSRDGALPLSFAQQRLWFIDQLEGSSPFYNSPAAVRLTGTLDTEALQRTLTEMVSRHESLRTRFVSEGGEPLQVIDEAGEVSLPVTDLTELGEEEREAEARRMAGEEARLAFDLSRGPLLRARLLRLGEEEHVALFTMHHIISDGWSMGVLIREVAALYEAFSRGEESPLSELPVQYGDYAVWQREWLRGEVLERQLSYWRSRLGGELPVLELPCDGERGARSSHRGATYAAALPADLSAGLRELSRREGATLYMTLLSAFQVLLSRYTGQEDVLVGTAVANRTRGETEGLIGFFVNTLVMRGDVSGNPRFVELLGRVRECALGAYAHQDVPFEKLVEEMAPTRAAGRTPLVQVAFGVQNAPVGEMELNGLRLSGMGGEAEGGRFELTVWVREGAGGEIVVRWSYDPELYGRERVERMQGHYERLLAGVVERPEAQLSALDMLTVEEKLEQLLKEKALAAANYSKFKNMKPKTFSAPVMQQAHSA